MAKQRRWMLIPPSPPDSLDCREFSPCFFPKLANYAHFSRFFLHKSDCRERTALAADGINRAVFSGAAISSPTSRESGSEHLAITNRTLCERDLTFGYCGSIAPKMTSADCRSRHPAVSKFLLLGNTEAPTSAGSNVVPAAHAKNSDC